MVNNGDLIKGIKVQPIYRELCVPVYDSMVKDTCCSSHAGFVHVNREV